MGLFSDFLISENSLYSDNTSKEALLKDKESIADAFFINYLGFVSLYKISNGVAAMKDYLANEKGTRLREIDDTNNDLTLTLKLYGETGGIPKTYAQDMAMFIYKLKNRQIKPVDLDANLVRKQLDHILYKTHKPSLLILDIVKDFHDGTITLEQVAKKLMLVTKNKKFKPVSQEFRNVGIKYAPYLTKININQPAQTSTVVQTAQPVQKPSQAIQQPKVNNNTSSVVATPSVPVHVAVTQPTADIPATTNTPPKYYPEKQDRHFFDSVLDQSSSYTDEQAARLGWYINPAEATEYITKYSTDLRLPRDFARILNAFRRDEDAQLFLSNFLDYKLNSVKNYYEGAYSHVFDALSTIESVTSLKIKYGGKFDKNTDIYKKAEKISVAAVTTWGDKANLVFVKRAILPLKILSGRVEKNTIKLEFQKFSRAIIWLYNQTKHWQDSPIYLTHNNKTFYSYSEAFRLFKNIDPHIKSNGGNGIEPLFVLTTEEQSTLTDEDISALKSVGSVTVVDTGADGTVKVPESEYHKVFGNYESLEKWVLDNINPSDSKEITSLLEQFSYFVKNKTNYTTDDVLLKYVVAARGNVAIESLYMMTNAILVADAITAIEQSRFKTSTDSLKSLFYNIEGMNTQIYELCKERFKTLADTLIAHAPIRVDDVLETGYSSGLVNNGFIAYIIEKMLTRIYKTQDFSMSGILHYVNHFHLLDMNQNARDCLARIGKEFIANSKARIGSSFIIRVYDYLIDNGGISHTVIDEITEMLEPSDILVCRYLYADYMPPKAYDVFKEAISHTNITTFRMLSRSMGMSSNELLDSKLPKKLIDDVVKDKIEKLFETTDKTRMVSYDFDLETHYALCSVLSTKDNAFINKMFSKKETKDILMRGFVYLPEETLIHFSNIDGLIKDFDVETMSEFLNTIEKYVVGKKRSLVEIKNTVAANITEKLVDEFKEGDSKKAEEIYSSLDTSYKNRILSYLEKYSFVEQSRKDIYKDANPIKPYGKLDHKFIQKILQFNDIVPPRIPRKSAKTLDALSKTIDQSMSGLNELAVKQIDIPEGMTNQEYFERKTLEYSVFNARRHGNFAVKFLREFDVSIPKQKELNAAWNIKYPNQEIIKPAFHGTGSVAASMILRYGFAVINDRSGAVTTTGKMLGNGVYCSNKLDKVGQYISDGGYSRGIGHKGYIFEMAAYLGDKEWKNIRSNSFPQDGSTYASAGLKNDGIRSPEWCLFYPNEQLVIYKAYEVELVNDNLINSLKNKYPDMLKECVEIKTFKHFITEGTKQKMNGHYETFIFMDENIPVSLKDTVKMDEFDAKKYGNHVFVEPCAQGVAVVFRNTEKTKIYAIPRTYNFINEKDKINYFLDLLHKNKKV